MRANAAYSPFQKKNARLVLEDGSVWAATSFGATGTEIGEVRHQEPAAELGFLGTLMVIELGHTALHTAAARGRLACRRGIDALPKSAHSAVAASCSRTASWGAAWACGGACGA